MKKHQRRICILILKRKTEKNDDRNEKSGIKRNDGE